jgi:hypothetical protein
MPAFSNCVETDASRGSTAGLTAVGALGYQVVVRSTTAAGSRAVASLFRNMREPARPDVLGSLELRRTRTGWIVSGGSDVEAVHNSLSQARWELRERVTGLLMNARPDLVWLHASGVARDNHAVLISGPSGSGKSRLATNLVAEGFDYLGDDVLPFDPCTRMAHPFPVTLSVRTGAAQYVLTAEARRLRKRGVVVRQAQVATGPMPIAAIVFPRFAPGPTRMQPMSAGRVAIELLRQCRDFERHREAAVRAISDLAASVPSWDVSYVDPVLGAGAVVRVHEGGNRWRQSNGRETD